MIDRQDIVNARVLLGMSQLEAAVKIGVSYPAYRLWEKGGSKPSPKNEKKLRKVLKLGGRENEQTSNDTASR